MTKKSDYKLPEGCVADMAELKALLDKGAMLYVVWEPVHFAKIASRPFTRIKNGTAKGLTITHYDQNSNIITNSSINLLDLVFSPNEYCYHYFTNFWQAYAYCLQMKARLSA